MSKTAQQVIDAWVAQGNLDAPLFLNEFAEIPPLPDTVRRLWAGSAKVLPKLPLNLRGLSADSVTALPELPPNLMYLSANSAVTLSELPASMTRIDARIALSESAPAPTEHIPAHSPS